MKRYLAIGLFLAASRVLASDATWVVESSTLTYSADHPLHGSKGVSHAARGKALCGGEGCRFLAAAPVISFVSGDTNRDLHMLETTRGAKFPMISVSGVLPAFPTGNFSADIDVEFAGLKASYKAVPFTATVSDQRIAFQGVVPATMTDFSIPAPSLLGIPLKNSIPVAVSMTWKKAE